MKKLGLIFKETSANRIKKYFEASEAVFVVKYSGLSSPSLSTLRQNLRSSKALFFVVKNSVARRVLNNLGKDSLVERVEGPCGFIFIDDEPVNTSKVVCSFIKEHEQLKLEGGILKDKLLEKQDILSMSLLPSKEQLRAQVVMTLNSPISGLAICLNQILAKFVYCIDQIKEKKQTK